MCNKNISNYQLKSWFYCCLMLWMGNLQKVLRHQEIILYSVNRGRCRIILISRTATAAINPLHSDWKQNPAELFLRWIPELIIQDKSINVKDSTYNFSMILCSCPSSGTWDLLNFCPLISELFPTYVSQSFGIKPNICDILFFLYFLKSGKLSGFVVR